MEDFINTFKKFVPAEILAAFIAINSLVPYDSWWDTYAILPAIALLTLLFAVELLIYKKIKSAVVGLIVVAAFPFWCVMIAMERFEETFFTDTLRVFVSVALIFGSLGLTIANRGQESPSNG